jgi:protein-S-isoprenylcysteine O-methyltransferase Ste14
MLILRLTRRTVLTMAIVAGLLFVPAGTLDWWRAWVFLAVNVLIVIASCAWLYVHSKALLEERLAAPVQRGQPLADKIIVILFLVLYVGWFLFIPVDVFHLQLLEKPDALISSAGLLLFIVGVWVIFLALRENAFASPVIKHQQSREHKVVDTGIYGVVRHPMYAGFIPMAIGTALWLESYAAVALTALPIAALAARIAIEEAFLKRELQGYEAYTQKVRYRLIPWVW